MVNKSMVQSQRSLIRYNFMVFIDPNELQDLEPEETVMVNRVALNRQRVAITMKTHARPGQAKIILNRTIQEIRRMDRQGRRPCFGAKMKVSEARIVFDDFKQLPKNTFASIEKK